VTETPKSSKSPNTTTEDKIDNQETKADKQKGSILKRLAAKFSPKMSKKEIKEESESNESSQKTDQTDQDDQSSFSDRLDS